MVQCDMLTHEDQDCIADTDQSCNQIAWSGAGELILKDIHALSNDTFKGVNF